MIYDTVTDRFVFQWVGKFIDNQRDINQVNVKMSNVNQFRHDINILYYSVLFIKNINLLHIYIKDTFLRTCKPPLLLMLSCEISESFKTAIL